MNNSQKILLELIKYSLFGREDNIVLSDSVVWSDLFKEAQDQTVVGLVTPSIKKMSETQAVPNLFVSDQLK